MQLIDHSKIDRLEAEILKLPKAECPVRHIFSDGIYAREMTAQAGTVITGAIHRTRHLNIISKGSITVYNELGDLRHIRAPYAFVSEPGTRRAGFVHEELVWTTIHPTHETDIQKLESILTEPYVNPLTINAAPQPCLS